MGYDLALVMRVILALFGIPMVLFGAFLAFTVPGPGIGFIVTGLVFLGAALVLHRYVRRLRQPPATPPGV